MHSSLWTAWFAVIAILPVLSAITVALRFVARNRTKAGCNADDYIILTALVRLLHLQQSFQDVAYDHR